jgi:lipopolysaccharide biosynthesis glycosyltransferase
MKHITLASDTKYLLFAVTLIRSVQKHSSIPLTFHYYCLDQNTFEKIQKLKLQNVIVYRPETLVSNDILVLVKNTQKQKLTDLKIKEYHYFCW